MPRSCAAATTAAASVVRGVPCQQRLEAAGAQRPGHGSGPRPPSRGGGADAGPAAPPRTQDRHCGSGDLRFDGGVLALSNGPITGAAGGAVEYSNTTVDNGFLRDPGPHTLLAGSNIVFNAVTTSTPAAA